MWLMGGICSRLERRDPPDHNVEETSGSCPEPMSEKPSPHAEDVVVKPVPTPGKDGNGEVDILTPPLRRSQRRTAGSHQNPFNLPRSSCNTLSFSPDALSELLAGMVLYTSKLQENVDGQEVTRDVDL